VTDKTNLSYWFPLIRDVGLPVPRTEIIEMPEDVWMEAWQMFDGVAFDAIPKYKAWAEDFEKRVNAFGRPLFLRTGHTSGKHNWKETCAITPESSVMHHLYNIIEFSEIAGMMGELPWRNWVLREMLPVKPYGVCRRYGDMPVVREFRVFVDGGKVECHHPYWPTKALQDGGVFMAEDVLRRFHNFNDDDELKRVLGLASDAGKAVGGRWSVDMLETDRGWFVTDMAEAEKSYHWEGCANGREKP
jgi:hypothetical protein